MVPVGSELLTAFDIEPEATRRVLRHLACDLPVRSGPQRMKWVSG